MAVFVTIKTFTHTDPNKRQGWRSSHMGDISVTAGTRNFAKHRVPPVGKEDVIRYRSQFSPPEAALLHRLLPLLFRFGIGQRGIRVAFETYRKRRESSPNAVAGSRMADDTSHRTMRGMIKTVRLSELESFVPAVPGKTSPNAGGGKNHDLDGSETFHRPSPP